MGPWKKLWLTVTVAPLALAACSAGPDGMRPIVTLGERIELDKASSPYERGKLHLAEGQLGLAIKQFQTALVLEPSSVTTLNALGAAYDRLGRFDLAERSYRQALVIEPQSAQTLNNLGYSYIMRGKYDLAVAYLRDARNAAGADQQVERNWAFAETALKGATAPDADELAAAPVETPAAPEPAISGRPRIERTTASVQTLITGLGPSVAMDAALPPIAAPLQVAAAPKVETGRISGFAAAGAPTPLLLARPGAEGSARTAPALDEARALPGDASRPAPGPGPRLVTAPKPSGSAEATARPAGAPALKAPLLEVSNGAGRLRMAARMREHLANLGVRTNRLTNADNFRHQSSTIYYRPGWEDTAAQLAARLPVAVVLVERKGQFADVRLELGGDLLEFDRDLIYAARRSSRITAG